MNLKLLKGLSLCILTFFYFSPKLSAQVPTITSVTPNYGKLGDTITLAGSNLNGPSFVKFKGVNGQIVSSNSSQIKVKVPAGALTGQISVYRNNRIGSSPSDFHVQFATQFGIISSSLSGSSSITMPYNALKTFSEDLNNDGKKDYLMYHGASFPFASVRRNTSSSGSSSFVTSTFNTQFNQYGGACLIDYNRDGLKDYVSGYNSGSNTWLIIYRNTSVTGGAISFSNQYSDYVYSGTSVFNTILSADLNSDGYEDLLYYNSGSSTLNYSLFNGVSFTGSTTTSITLPSAIRNLLVADMDNDGRRDLVFSSTANTNISIVRCTSTSSSSVSYLTSTPVILVGKAFVHGSITIGDFNLDNKVDLVVNNQADTVISVFQNTSTSGISFDTKVDFPCRANTMEIDIADVDGDGLPDIGMANTSNQGICLLKNAITSAGALSVSSFSNPVYYSSTSGLQYFAFSDHNMDGRPDIITLSNSGTLTTFNNQIPAPSGYTLSASDTISTVVNTVNVSWKPMLINPSAQSYSYQLFRDGGLIASFANRLDTTYADLTMTEGDYHTYEVRGYYRILGSDRQFFSASDVGYTFHITNLFSASRNQSDAYIVFNWRIPLNYLASANGRDVYVQLFDNTNQKEIYHEIIDSLPQGSIYPSASQYRHFVGDNFAANYSLNLFAIGPGTPLAAGIFNDNGATDPFRRPTFVSNPNLFPDRIELNFNNNTQIASTLKIYREGQLIQVIDSSSVTFTDKYLFNNPNTMVNNRPYKYYVEAYNLSLNKSFPRDSIMATTVPVNFSASDNLFTDRVELTWNSMANFGEGVRLNRDGNFLALLPSTAITYTDKRPIFGKKHAYELILIQDDINTLSVRDSGGVKAIGMISGRVTTTDGNFAVARARINATAAFGNDTVRLQTFTDPTGYYHFDEVYFDEAAVYELKIVATGHSFSPSTLIVSLDNVNTIAEEVDFKSGKIYNTNGNRLLNLSQLLLSAVDSSDVVNISWNYTSSDTTYFKIFRDGRLQTILYRSVGTSMDYTDYYGTPGRNHNYRVEAYVLYNNVITQKTASDTIRYPILSPIKVSNFSVMPDNLLSQVQLLWSHPSINYSGVRIFRSGQLISNLSKAQGSSFIDLTGYNDSSFVYGIQAFTLRGDSVYLSSTTISPSVNYPSLLPPASMVVSLQPAFNGVNMSWAHAAASGYNFDGYKLVRRGGGRVDTIATVDKRFPKVYFDVKAQQLTAYSYIVYAYKKNSYSLSLGDSAVITYPAIAQPFGFTASNGTHEGWIRLNWTNPAENYDGLRLINTTRNDTIILPTGTSTYDYVLPSNFTTGIQNFVITSFRRFDNIIQYSGQSSASGSSAAPSGTYTRPSAFTASTSYRNQVALNWTYPTFIQPKFYLFRDGTLIDSLSYDQRNYYDYSVQAGQEYLYQIQAKSLFSTDISAKVAATGRVVTLSTLSGTVFSLKGSTPVVNATIQANTIVNGKVFFRETTTDSSGFYRFTDIPEMGQSSSLTAKMQVKAFKQNYLFNPDTINVTINNSTQQFVVDFVDTLQNDEIQSDLIASVSYLNATPNPQNNSVEIRWASTNNNYTGFRVYRGATEIGVVVKGEQLLVVDTSGFPAYNYLYRVKAYWELPEGLFESQVLSISADYPMMLPATDIKALPDATNNRMRISWSHPTNAYSHYELNRNDKLIATIPTTNQSTFVDLNGIPGQAYTYSVTAVLVKGNRKFYSEPISVNTIYPTLQMVQNLNDSTTIISNAVRLSWNYPTTQVGGFRIFRERELIAVVADPTRTYFEDFGGDPGSNHLYSVTAFAKRDSSTYESRLVNINRVYPALQIPINFTATAIDSMDKVTLEWFYPYGGANAFNIYRGSTLIGTVSDSLATSFDDPNGIPNTNYNYQIAVVAIRSSTFESAKATVNVTFPNVSKPLALSATTDLEDRVSLSWRLPSAANTGFIVYRTSGSIDTIPMSGARVYNDVFKKPITGNFPFVYQLRSYKIINNAWYLSDFSDADTGFASNYTGLVARDNPNLGGSPFNPQAGWSVSQDGEYAVVGAPSFKVNGFSAGAAYVYKWEGYWKYQQTLLASDITASVHENFGFSVSISGDWIIIGNLTKNGNQGKVYAFRNFGGTWLEAQTFQSGVSGAAFGRSVSIKGNYMAIGSAGDNKAYMYRYNGTSWILEQTLSGVSGSDFGWSVSVDADKVLIGAPKESISVAVGFCLLGCDFDQACTNFGGCIRTMPDAGRAFLYQRNTSAVWNQIQIYQDEDLESGGYNYTTSQYFNFASQVFINDDKVFIYAPGTGSKVSNVTLYSGNNRVSFNSITGGGSSLGGLSFFNNNLFIGDVTNNRGIVNQYFINPSNNAITFIKSFFPTNTGSATLNQMGFSISAGPQNLIAGAPSENSNQGTFYTFGWESPLPARLPVVANLSASDGTQLGYTRITWNSTSSQSNVNKYNIYRDDVLLASTNPSTLFYNDYDGMPGQKYVYSVSVEDNNNLESKKVADVGFSRPNGKIKGSVFTFSNGVGVPNVLIKASATIGGERFDYQAYTDADGYYTINNVYYADSATYSVSPYYPKHIFVKDKLDATLDAISSIATLGPFLDKTAYIIRGNVKRMNVSCGLDSIKLNLTQVKASGVRTPKDAYTNIDGNYSFNYDPTDPDNVKYVLRITSYKLKDGDTTNFKFSMDSVVIIPYANSPLDTVLNVLDTTTKQIQLVVQNTCGPNSITDKYYINVRTPDDCYNRTILTNGIGKYTDNFPPLDFIMTVTDVEQPTVNNIPILTYLNPRPVHYDVESILKDTVLNKLPLKVIFTYHKVPKIEVNGFTNYLCNNSYYPAVLNMGTYATLNIDVSEVHNGNSCTVNEGYIRIKNGAALNNDTTVYFDITKGNFPEYSFLVGPPRLISPHCHYITIQYYTEAGGFQNSITKAIIVTGQNTAPGNDFILELDTMSNGQVQMPLFVLRDPPGDGSYSYVEKGTSFTRTLSVSDNNNGKAGLSTDFKIIGGGVGVAVKLKAIAGGGSGRSASYEVSGETTTRYETSDGTPVRADQAGWLVGERADVIVGAGVSYGYGIAQDISIDPSGCRVLSKQIISTAPEKIKTTWVYTIDQIEELIKLYDRQIADAEEDKFVIKGLTKAATKKYIGVLKKNWEQMLVYHRQNTVPYYNLCDVANYGKLPEPFKTQILDWTKNGFCTKIGSYSTVNGVITFKLNDKISWTTELLDKFNKVNKVVRDLTDEGYQLNYPGGLTFSQSQLDKVKVDAQYNAEFGADAENISFTGGTKTAKEVKVSKSSNRGYSQNWFFDFEGFVGLAYKGGVRSSVGTALGALFSVDAALFEIEGQDGIEFAYHHDFERKTENTIGESASVGYVLNDGDPGDQFSVTILRGLDKTQSPYFSLLGGRSSCPYEPGTIARDTMAITLETPDGTGYDNDFFDQDPDKPVLIPIKLSNGNPFHEDRPYQIYLDPTTNPYNATVKYSGFVLGQQQVFILKDTSVYGYLSIERNPLFYQYHGLTIYLNSDCEGVLRAQTKVLNIDFLSPCSKISILDPTDNWVIKKAPNPTAREFMIFTLGDYDINNQKLDRVDVQYRRVGTNNWITVGSITRDSLKNYYNEYKTIPPRPASYPFIWDITGNTLIADGDYEIRARANCTIYGSIFSNIVKGTISRKTIELFGTPQPADGVLSLGDEISISFNKDVDCGVFNPANFKLIRKSDSSIVPVTVSCGGNQLVFSPTVPLSSLDGQDLIARIDSVVDRTGNMQTQAVAWQFKVSNNPVYWNPGALNINVYRGSRDTISATLFNAQVGGSATYVISKSASWLSGNPFTGNAPYIGQNIKFVIDATNLVQGDYYDTAVATIAGFSDLKLPISLHVYPNPPQWSVNPADFTNSINVVANYKINGGPNSIDSLDKIAVTIDGKIRGVANIRKFGTSNYAAYITVYGNANDAGRLLEYRVWSASKGIEYDAHLGDTLRFSLTNSIYGSILQPRILNITDSIDIVRFIPLTAGWNWISVNKTHGNMSVGYMLRNLKSSNGDLIKTLNSMSQFDENTRNWITVDGLGEINTAKGYMLKLAKADTLRLSGRRPIIDPINLSKGWNLIGYPHQQNRFIDDVLNKTTIVPEPQNYALVKTDVQTATYNRTSGKWSGTLDSMRYYKAYLIRVDSINNSVLDLAESLPGNWIVDAGKFDQNMTFTAIIRLNGVFSSNAGDAVAAFVGNECRGVGELQFIPSINAYRLTMFVYSNGSVNEKVTFKIFDNQNSMQYNAAEEIIFSANATYGTISAPYVFKDVFGTGVHQLLNTSLGIIAYPNPFKENVSIRFVSKQEKTLSLVLYDQTGREIMEQIWLANKGENNLELNFQKFNLGTGIYTLKISGSDVIENVKLIKLN